MTRNFTFFLATDKLDLITLAKQTVTISSTGIQTYTGDDVTINYVTGYTSPSVNNDEYTVVSTPTNGFLFTKLVNLVVIKTYATTPVEYNLFPFQTLSSTALTGVLDENKNVSVNLPSGPAYLINDSTNTFVEIEFNGGTETFQPGSFNDLIITVPEYNSGTIKIPLQIVQGSRKNIFVVNQNTLTYASPGANIVSAVPTFVTTVPANSTTGITSIIVSRSSGASSLDSMIVKEVSGQYIQYVFTFLERVDVNQTLLFTTSDTFGDILPVFGYDYTNSGIPLVGGLPAMTQLIPTGTLPLLLTPVYGELTINFKLILFNSSNNQVVDIYLTAVVGGSSNFVVPLEGMVEEIYAVDPNASNLLSSKSLSLPYDNGQFSFSAPTLDSNNVAYITITKTSSEVQVGQWFFNIAGTNILVQFHNVPAPSHQDIFIYDATTSPSVNTWNVDVAFSIQSAFQANNVPSISTYPSAYNPSILGEKIFTFLGNDISAVAQVNYYGTLYTFNITLESGTRTVVNVVQQTAITITGTIVSFTIDPTTFIPYSGSARMKTTNASIILTNNIITIRNDKPNNNDQENSTIYIKTLSGNLIYEIITHPIPYALNSNIQIEIYDNTATPVGSTFTPAYNFTPTIPNIIITGGTGSLSNIGLNVITYTFYDYMSGSFNALVSVIKLPSTNVDDYQIVAFDKPYTFNFITEYFGSNANYYRLDNAVATNITGGSTPPTDLPTIVFQATGQVIITNTVAGETYAILFTVNANPSRIPTIEASLNPSIGKNIKVSDILLSGTITFQSYDPSTVNQIILSNPAGSPMATFNLSNFVSGDKVNYVSYNGVQLTDTRNNGLDWTNFPTMTLSSAGQIVNDYFFYDTKDVTRVTTVCLISGTLIQTVNRSTAVAEPIIVDLFQLFFPNLRTQLIDANLSMNGSIDYTNYPLTGFTNPFTAQAISIQADGSSILLSSITVNTQLISTPTAPPSLTFTIPINVLFNLPSEKINPQYQLTIDMTAPPTSATALYATNGTDGINVNFPTAGTYSIDVILTASGTATTSAVITFVAYDPTQVISYNVSSYSGSTMRTLPNPITSYSIDGVVMPLTMSNPSLQINNSTSTPIITMIGTKINPTHVYVFTITTAVQDPLDSVYKNIIIYNFSYIPIAPATITTYLIKEQVLAITAQQISDASPSALINFNASSDVITSDGANIPNDGGAIVGYVVNPNVNVASLTLVGNEPGNWDNFIVNIVSYDTSIENGIPSSLVNVGASITSTVNVNVVTLASLILTNLPIFVFPINKPFDVDLNPFIVNKLAVNFTGWLVSINGATAVALPGYFSSISTSTGVVTGTVATTCSYTFTGTLTSQQHPLLTTSFSVQIIFYDPTNTLSQQVFLGALQPSTITLTGNVASIDGMSILPTASTFKDGNIQFGFGSSNQLTIQALVSLSSEQVYNLILTDGSNVLLTVQQTSGTENIIIASLNFSGTIFKPPAGMGNIITNYQVLGNSTTYLPGISYTLPNGGSVLINTNGSYTINTPTAITFQVSYGGTSNGTIQLQVQGNNPDVINVSQPSYTLPIPSSTLTVTVNSYMLSQGTPYTLTYARFTWIGVNVLVDNISSSFQQTSIQVESDTSTSTTTGNIQINEYDLVLSQDTGTLNNIIVGTGSTVSISIGFTPISVIYDGATINGSQASFPIIVEQRNIGSFTFNGQILTIIAGMSSGYSKLLGFVSSSKTTTYYQIQFTSSIIDTPVLPGSAPITFPTTIGVVGDATSQVFPVVGSTITLNNKVNVISNTAIQVLNFNITGSYTFYVSLTNGVIITYIVNFQTIDIYVPNVAKFLIASFLPTGQIPTFQETSISTAGIYVLNPNSLGQITMLTPYNAKITLHST